jgi:hypothetical protein
MSDEAMFQLAEKYEELKKIEQQFKSDCAAIINSYNFYVTLREEACGLTRLQIIELNGDNKVIHRMILPKEIDNIFEAPSEFWHEAAQVSVEYRKNNPSS